MSQSVHGDWTAKGKYLTFITGFWKGRWTYKEGCIIFPGGAFLAWKGVTCLGDLWNTCNCGNNKGFFFVTLQRFSLSNLDSTSCDLKMKLVVVLRSWVVRNLSLCLHSIVDMVTVWFRFHWQAKSKLLSNFVHHRSSVSRRGIKWALQQSVLCLIVKGNLLWPKWSKLTVNEAFNSFCCNSGLH